MVWAMLACFHFRNRKYFTSSRVKDAIVHSCVPKHVQELVSAVWEEPPSMSTLSRRQLALDLSFAFTFAKSMATFDGAIYIWTDASVQGKTDLLLSTMDYVSAWNLRRCYDSAISLSRSIDYFISTCDSDAEDTEETMSHAFALQLHPLSRKRF